MWEDGAVILERVVKGGGFMEEEHISKDLRKMGLPWRSRG